MFNRMKMLLAGAAMALVATNVQAAPIKIQWWHAMNGVLGTDVE